MPVQYGEITIIHNEKEEGLVKSIFRTLFDYEFKPQKNSQIIVLFENGEICEIKDKLKDFHYEIFDDSLSMTPRYFDKNINNTHYRFIYFRQESKIFENKEYLDFNNLFKYYSKYSKDNTCDSTYNCVYYKNKCPEKVEVFGIIRLKSTETKPRFQFAYDTDEFSIDEVIYLINYIFKNKIQS